MERMSAEDSRAIMEVVQQSMIAILEESVTRLSFPIKVTATCPAGLVMALSIAYRGAEPVPTVTQGVAMVGFPITVACIGKDGRSVTGIIEQPTRHTEGTA
jgi:hypothetical protein